MIIDTSSVSVTIGAVTRDGHRNGPRVEFTAVAADGATFSGWTRPWSSCPGVSSPAHRVIQAHADECAIFDAIQAAGRRETRFGRPGSR